MTVHLEIENLSREIAHHHKEGNFNTVIHLAVTHPDTLRSIWPELVKIILGYFTASTRYVSKASVQKLLTLPESRLGSLLPILKSFESVKPTPSVGCIQFPVVTSTGTVCSVCELIVEDNDKPQLEPHQRSLLDQIGSPVISYLKQKLNRSLIWRPESFRYSIYDSFGNEDNTVEGYSLGLPLALALYSHLVKEPVPAGVSATGQVMRNGVVKPVDKIGEKLKAIQAERAYIKKVLISDKQKIDEPIGGLYLIKISTVKDAIGYVFKKQVHPKNFPDLDIKSEADNLKKQYDSYLIDTCIRNADELIHYIESMKRPLENSAIKALFTCYWRKGSSHCHKGEVQKTYYCIEKAKALQKSNPDVIPINDYLNMLINYAVSLKDVFLYKEAEALHAQIAKQTEKILGLGREKGKNLSSLSQLYLAREQYAKAIKWQIAAIEFIPAREQYRNFGYLAQIYTRKGDFNPAHSALKKAERLISKPDSGAREIDRDFLKLYQAEYLYQKGIRMKQPNKTFMLLHSLAKDHDPINLWVQALIQKYNGLSFLFEGNEDKGLEAIKQAVSFLEKDITPMYGLLIVSIHAETVFLLLKTGKTGSIREYLINIKKYLNMQKDIKAHFSNELKQISHFLRFKNPGKIDKRAATKTMETIVLKIPF